MTNKSQLQRQAAQDKAGRLDLQAGSAMLEGSTRSKYSASACFNWSGCYTSSPVSCGAWAAGTPGLQEGAAAADQALGSGS